MKTTAPILAIGAITLANATILGDKPFSWRVPIATGMAALLFAGAEKVWEPGAVGLAYVALVTTLFVDPDGGPAPIQTAHAWWSSGQQPKTRPRYIYT